MCPLKFDLKKENISILNFLIITENKRCKTDLNDKEDAFPF